MIAFQVRAFTMRPARIKELSVQTEYAQLDNHNVEQQEVLITPTQLKLKLPVNENVRSAVNDYRQTVRNILDHHDPRMLVVVGPCSIHDEKSALEYAERLKIPKELRIAIPIRDLDVSFISGIEITETSRISDRLLAKIGVNSLSLRVRQRLNKLNKPYIVYAISCFT